MSDAPAAAIPPGWYADTTVPGQLRWWNGTEWTEHVSAPYSTAPQARQTLPPGRPIYSVFIWLIVLLPLASIGFLFAWQPDFSSLSSLSTDPTAAATAPLTSLFTPGYFLIVLGGLVIYGLNAVFAWRDVVWLRKQGVERPFAWPWIFLYSPVYVIGRSVIVRRVAAPRGLAPIWVYIAVIVVGFIASIAWTALLLSQIATELPTLDPGQYTG
ncbi:MAG TPA: DUF2510 domain-containing protein [Pseudolysinimonas sp.]|jgi:hypothetical protein